MESHLSSARRVLADGVIVDRLPLGFAAGRWWATFVFDVPADRYVPELLTRAFVIDPDGLLDRVGGSGGGDHEETVHTWELIDHGATTAEVRYDGAPDPELLRLDSTDRAGTFAVRLRDGSLLERLPVGRARGRWRLRWVRSDVPVAEVAAAFEDDDDDFPVSPLDRLVRLRAATGPLGPLPCSWSGGAIQPFATEVPDSVGGLEVDYLHAGEVVATEVLDLPQP